MVFNFLQMLFMLCSYKTCTVIVQRAHTFTSLLTVPTDRRIDWKIRNPYSGRRLEKEWKGSSESMQRAKLSHRFCLNNWGNRKTFIKALSHFPERGFAHRQARSHLLRLLERLLLKRNIYHLYAALIQSNMQLFFPWYFTISLGINFPQRYGTNSAVERNHWINNSLQVLLGDLQTWLWSDIDNTIKLQHRDFYFQSYYLAAGFPSSSLFVLILSSVATGQCVS